MWEYSVSINLKCLYLQSQFVLKFIAFGLSYFQSLRNIFDCLLSIIALIYIILAVVCLSGNMHHIIVSCKLICLRPVHNTTQDLALHCVDRALTLLAAQRNARIDSRIPLRHIHAFGGKKFARNTVFSQIANSMQCDALPCINIVNPPLVIIIYDPQ